ncbi:MAG TPA: MFS transporter [Solirubrobacteraceae bacterium]|nr:MFS transporter [Solirubrobacteraceae bacterium]
MASGPYSVLLRSPAVRWQALGGLLAQMTQGAGGIGIILVIRSQHGSLALAGAVVGAVSIAGGLARPAQGRFIDRRGPRGLMTATGIIHPAAVVAIVVLADAGAAGGALVALGVVAGAALPPVSACMRVAWGAASDDGDRTSAYSLVYLTQELSVLTGPLLLSIVVATTNASAALITVAAVTGVGTLGFAASLPSTLRAAGTSSREHGGAVLRAPGVQVLVPAAGLIGAVIGGLVVGVPTFATEHHAPAASGLLMAIVSVGGIIGAAVYGARRWHAAPTSRLLALLAALTVATALAVAAPDLVVLGAALALVGLPLNPSLTTVSLLLDSHVSAASATEAFGWLSTGIASGTGLSSALAGAVSHPGDPRPAFVVAAVAAVAAVLLVAASRRRLSAPAVYSR